jgi:hypothetical protein
MPSIIVSTAALADSSEMDCHCPSLDDTRYPEAKGHVIDLIQESSDLAFKVQSHLDRFLRELRQEEIGCSLQTTQERRKIEQRVANFVYEQSRAWHEISKKNWDQLTQAELLSIAQLLGNKLGLPIDREAKRRKRVLVKWFDEHLADLQPLFERIDLEYEPSPPSSKSHAIVFGLQSIDNVWIFFWR